MPIGAHAKGGQFFTYVKALPGNPKLHLGAATGRTGIVLKL